MASSESTAPRSKAREVMARMFSRGMPVHLEADEGARQQEQPSSADPAQQASRSKAEDETV